MEVSTDLTLMQTSLGEALFHQEPSAMVPELTPRDVPSEIVQLMWTQGKEKSKLTNFPVKFPHLKRVTERFGHLLFQALGVAENNFSRNASRVF